MINNTTLVGRVTKAPDLKFTAGNNIPVLSLSLAVERNFTNAQGERETDFINIVAWRGIAETMAQFLAKGSLVGITGSIQTRNYDNNEGRTIYVTEVVVDNFQMLEPKSVTDQRRNEQGAGQNRQNNGQNRQNNGQNNHNNAQNNYNQGQNNFNNQQQNNFNNQNFNNQMANNGVDDINDDDLPF